MAKKTKVDFSFADFKPGDPLPGPDPQPIAGDVVNYIFHEHAGARHAGKVYPATVKHVFEGHDGRLLNVEVELESGPERLGPTPYREYDQDAPAGNTWHWPEPK
jgi:hypothetical protein